MLPKTIRTELAARSLDRGTGSPRAADMTTTVGHGVDRAGRLERALKLVLVLTAAFLVAEVVGGIVADSLALLADAGHMLSDVLSLGRRAVRRLARGPPGRPAPHVRLSPRRDPRRALQRRHARRDLDLDLHRGGDALRRPAGRRGGPDAGDRRRRAWSSTSSPRGSSTATRARASTSRRRCAT